MATKSDVDFSQTGESTSSIDSVLSLPPEGEKPKQEFVIYKLADTKRKGRLYIDGIDDAVMNPVTKKRERIWLLNSVHSIWQSDLSDQLKDPAFMRSNRRSLQFESGICRIPVWDERALEFADACRHNIGSKDRRSGSRYDFYKYDPIKQQADALKKEMFEIEMVMKARDMEIAKVKKLASFFGISFNDDLGQYKGDDGVRTELMIRAKRDPINFSKYIDSKEVDVSYMVKKAILDAKIDLTGQNGNAIWAKGGGFIAKIPVGRKAYEYLTELALTNSADGKAFKEQLETIST